MLQTPKLHIHARKSPRLLLQVQCSHLSIDVDRGGEITLGLQLLNLIKYFEGWTQLESEAADNILAVEQQQGASINFLDEKRRHSLMGCIDNNIDSPR